MLDVEFGKNIPLFVFSIWSNTNIFNFTKFLQVVLHFEQYKFRPEKGVVEEVLGPPSYNYFMFLKNCWGGGIFFFCL